jgi:hypothetical protein
MHLMYHEMFDNIAKCNSKDETVELLKKYGDLKFKTFLQAAYSPRVEFDTPIPTYKPAPEPEGLNWVLLENEIPKLYRFVKNHPAKPQGLNVVKQKELLLLVLESLHKKEAELLVNAMSKNLTVPNLTKEVINEVFPGLL